MWQPIVKAAHFLIELTLGVLVILGFVCWVWFVAGLLYYKSNKDLPDYHVEAEDHEGMTWWNAWRWCVSDTHRPLSDNVIMESSIFGVASVLALIWVLDYLF